MAVYTMYIISNIYLSNIIGYRVLISSYITSKKYIGQALPCLVYYQVLEVSIQESWS